MEISRRNLIKGTAAMMAVGGLSVPSYALGDDHLPSWNYGAAKNAIVNFVKTTTDKSHPDFVQPDDRIAAFDQDGTTWVEHPLYTQAMFALARVGQLALKHPEWKTKQPFQAVLSGDREAMAKFTEGEWFEIIGATHTGSTEAFQTIVQDWWATAKNSRYDKPYAQMVYQPMLEVMKYFLENGYRTYIVTGGGQDFVRAYAQQVYGIPPEQIIGSALDTQYTYNQAGEGILMRDPNFC